MDKKFASRKFLLFLISTLAVILGWFYALLYKTDLLATISTLWMSLLAAYSGANLVAYSINKNSEAKQAPQPKPAADQQKELKS